MVNKVRAQMDKFEQFYPERKALLDEFKFPWWDGLHLFEVCVPHMRAILERHGDLRVVLPLLSRCLAHARARGRASAVSARRRGEEACVGESAALTQARSEGKDT